MTNIIINRVDELGPELTALARPLVAKWEAAILRVAAAQAQPTFMKFKPAAQTHEAILAKRFTRLTVEKKRTAGREAVISLKKPQLQARLGLVGVDLKAPRPIEQLIAAMPARVTKEQLTRLATARLASLGGMPQGVVGAPGSLKSLRLEMLRMVCVDETNGFLGNEWGSDEIALGGVTLDETAKVGKVGPFDLGEFDDNTRKDYLSAPKVLFTFDLSKAKTFPNSFFVTLVLVEEDFGDFSETVNDIIHKLEGETAEYLAALIGSEVGTAGGPLGTLVGLFVGWAVGKIVNSLISAWKDDPFTPQTIEVIIPSADANFGGDLTKPSEVIHFTGPGQYAMRYRWALTKVPRPVVTA